MAGAEREPSASYRNEHLVSCFLRGVGSSIREDSSITHCPCLSHRHSPGRVLVPGGYLRVLHRHETLEEHRFGRIFFLLVILFHP